MKECKFKIGDHVDIDAEKAAGKAIRAEVRLLQIIFGAQSLQRWRVIYRDLDKWTGGWMVWIESRSDEVQRFEECHLINRPENLTATKATIMSGNTAREILGIPKERGGGGKKYFRVIFKEKRKDE